MRFHQAFEGVEARGVLNVKLPASKGVSPQNNVSGGIDRRRFLKEGIGGILGLSCAGLVAACGSSSSSGTSSPTGKSGSAGASGIALASVPSYTNQYFTMWRRAGQEAATALGIGYVMQSYEGSASEQLSQLTAAKAADARQVTAFPIDNGDTPQMAKILASQNVYLATAFDVDPWEVPSDPSYGGYYTVNFLATEVAGTKAMSLAVFRHIGNSGKVIYIQGSPTDLTSVLRQRGFEQAVSETPGIRVVAMQYGYESEETTAPVINALLSRYPDVNAVVCHNSSEALAVNVALQQRGMTHVKVGSSDEETDILDQMIHGPNQVVVRAIFGLWTGGYMVVRNFDAQHGVHITPVERMMDQDSLVLDTKESAALFRKIGFESATTGYDWRGMSRALNPQGWDPQNLMKPQDPAKLFATDLGKPKPPGYSFPPELAKQLSDGDLGKYSQLYASHTKSSPFAPAIAKTTTGRTVLGFRG
jgi:ribose transport system substrate-binding protein